MSLEAFGLEQVPKAKVDNPKLLELLEMAYKVI